MPTFFRKIDVRVYATLVSIILCLLAYSKHNPLNYDGILYLAVASAYLKSGIAAAMRLYSWPFYSFLIAWLSKFSSLTLLHAAYVLNNLFLIITITAFITLLKELDGSLRLQVLGAVIILVYPQLNEYRDFVVRDFGYWAFFLVAFWQLLRFSKTERWSNALAWELSILLATLFRIEGILLLLFVPFVFLFLREKTGRVRIKLFLQAYSVFLLGIGTLAIYCLKHPQLLTHLGRVPEAIRELQDGWSLILHNFQQKALLAGNTVLSPFSTAQAPTFLVFGLAGLFISLLISTLSPLYALLVGHAMATGLLKLTKNDKLVLYYFTALNLLIPAVFFAQQFFLSGRYLLAFSLLLLLWTPFSLQQLFIYWRAKTHHLLGRKGLLPLVILIMTGMASGSVFEYGYSKAYIRQAGEWIADNTPAITKVYSNNKQILFYAKRTPIDFTVNWLEKYDDSRPLQTVTSKKWQEYDYLALRITHKSLTEEPAILKIMQGPPLKVFRNNRGDEVLIFDINKIEHR